jgi:hypothetical protein
LYLNGNGLAANAVQNVWFTASSHTHTVIPNYPSFPLDDLNDSYVLPVPEGLDNAQKKLLDSLTVSLLDANKLERETREQSSCDEWVQARKLRFTASRFGKVEDLEEKRTLKSFVVIKSLQHLLNLEALNMAYTMSQSAKGNTRNTWGRLVIQLM